MPPTGGFGGNTGIHDAHNLAWKLALVIEGWASPKLLDSYDIERRRIARCTLDQSLARLASWFENRGRPLPPAGPIVADLNVILGQIYPSGALLRENAAAEVCFEDPGEPSGQPGARAPHLVIERAGARAGIHDLFGRRFVLLSQNPSWRDAARSVRRGGFPVSGFQIGVDIRSRRKGADGIDVEAKFMQRYGVGEEGASLVRPDGMIAWRSAMPPAAQGEPLAKVLATICGTA
jgi:hypothetical protein